MSQNRREFVKNVLVASSFPLTHPKLSNITEISDWEEIRTFFALQKKRIYLNNGTFGPSPFTVLEAIHKSLIKTNTTGEYGHTNDARASLAKFVGVSTEEISLTHNTTEGINTICWGLNLQAGDEVIITLQEHVGNALPWLHRAKIAGLKLVPFEPAPTAEATIKQIEKLISPKTKVIAIPHITCTTGQVLPIEEICKIAQKLNIFTAIDGAHGPGSLNLNLKKIGCDSYATSCHKWMLGPNGTGFLYVKKERIASLRPTFVGAYSDTGWDLYSKPPHIKGYNASAHRFDFASQSTPLYEGAAEAAKFHTQIGKEKIEKRIKELNQFLFEGLKGLSHKLEIVSPSEALSRNCMLSFKPRNKDYKQVAIALGKVGFRVRQVPESKLNAIRVSTHIYNSKNELRDFIRSLEKIL